MPSCDGGWVGGGAHITHVLKMNCPYAHIAFPFKHRKYFHTILLSRPPEPRRCAAVSLHHVRASLFQSFHSCPPSSHRDNQFQLPLRRDDDDGGRWECKQFFFCLFVFSLRVSQCQYKISFTARKRAGTYLKACAQANTERGRLLPPSKPMGNNKDIKNGWRLLLLVLQNCTTGAETPCRVIKHRY